MQCCQISRDIICLHLFNSLFSLHENRNQWFHEWRLAKLMVFLRQVKTRVLRDSWNETNFPELKKKSAELHQWPIDLCLWRINEKKFFILPIFIIFLMLQWYIECYRNLLQRSDEFVCIGLILWNFLINLLDVFISRKFSYFINANYQ